MYTHTSRVIRILWANRETKEGQSFMIYLCFSEALNKTTDRTLLVSIGSYTVHSHILTCSSISSWQLVKMHNAKCWWRLFNIVWTYTVQWETSGSCAAPINTIAVYWLYWVLKKALHHWFVYIFKSQAYTCRVWIISSLVSHLAAAHHPLDRRIPSHLRNLC